MVATDGIGESAAVAGWWEALDELHRRVAHRFARSEAREGVKRYLLGLLGRVERKNGWQLAEAMGERDPQGVQRLMNSARWDAEEVRDDLREYVFEHLGDEETGVLIVDETGFLKKGEKSVGVPRHYTGVAGETVNCQVAVFLAYASKKGAAFLDRALYLPRAWTNDPARRTEAGVPERIVFRNKIELAQEMLERAFKADVPTRWVLADSFYGRSHAFRVWLEERGKPYAVMVPKTNAVPLGGRKKKIEKLVERLGEGAFSEVRPAAAAAAAAAQDASGRGPWEWACLDLAPDSEKEMRRWLLARRSTDDPENLGFYQAYGPEGTQIEELVRVCQERWAVEECFAEAKGEVGLDHYEVRRWEAWYRHITLCLLAHAFLALTRRAAVEEQGSPKRGSRSQPDPSDSAGGAPSGASYGRATGATRFPLWMVGVQKGSPGGCGSLPKGKPGRKTCRPASSRHGRTPQGRSDPTRRGAPHRRAMGVGAPPAAPSEGRDRQATQRPPHRLGRHTLGGEDWVVVAGDAPGIGQVGECLQTPRAVGEAGLVAAYPPSVGRGRSAGTGDQGA